MKGCRNRAVTVAGAGIWGCTVARVLAEAGCRVRVLERRAAPGGNCRCEIDPATGIEIHSYGSHIFHTSSREVWDFVNRFTAFNGYRHTVLAHHNGRDYHLPLGRTLYREFGTDDPQAVFDAFIRNYTAKQWGMPADRVDPAVIRRLKVRDTDSIRYFDDPFEGIPSEGFNRLFDRLLDHPGISLECGHAVTLAEIEAAEEDVFYSGPIDGLFDFRFGPLPWRTLRFELERRAVADAQGTSVVNYVDADVPYTRQHEYKHFHPEWRDVMARGETVLCREYPKAWEPGDEPYYPISSPESQALLERYRTETAGVPNLIVGGRLGGYRYLDMDKSVADALAVAGAWLEKQERISNGSDKGQADG